MEKDNIVMIFANPIMCTHPIDQARLVKRIIKYTSIEYWQVEYTNEEGRLYDAWIRILNNKQQVF